MISYTPYVPKLPAKDAKVAKAPTPYKRSTKRSPSLLSTTRAPLPKASKDSKVTSVKYDWESAVLKLRRHSLLDPKKAPTIPHSISTYHTLTKPVLPIQIVTSIPKVPGAKKSDK
jgi:hypothetical protein